MKNNQRLFAFSICLLLLNISQISSFAQTSGWTHFRGSNLNGISEDTLVPVHWSDTTNIVWRTDVRGRGWSSPVVLGNQVWMTTATVDGKEMSGICLDFKSGKPLFDILLFKQDSIYGKHPANTYASPTPCIEPGFVYLNFGSSGTACVNTENGQIVWKRSDLKCDHMQGTGSSPILYKDLLIIHFEGTDHQFIVALNKKTGETVWQSLRPAEYYNKLSPVGRKAYVTPIVVKVAGKDLLISNGAAVCIAYEAETGKEVWRVVQGEDSTIAMPFSEEGIVFFYTSFVTQANGEKYAEMLAVDPKGLGDITRTNVLWRVKTPVLQLLTPLIKDRVIYTVDSRNNLSAIDARRGDTLYSKKLKNRYNSSPVYAGGRIYFTSVKGETLVLQAGRVLQVISENKLPGDVYATPAIFQNSILIRNEFSLYRIGAIK